MSLPKRSVSFWSVQAVLYTRTITVKKTPERNKQAPTVESLQQVSARREGAEARIVVYSEHFERLLKSPMNLRDRLVVELPTFNAFRSGEVSSLRLEHIDFEHGDVLVLDSKKLELILEPLNATVGKHLDEYIRQEGIREGFVVRALPSAHHVGHKPGSKTLGAGLGVNQIENIWKKCCLAAGVPVMAPRMGRAFFAAKWHLVERKSIYGLMVMMRHTNLRVTEDYLEKLIDYPAVKAEFNQGQPAPFSLSSPCRFLLGCPLAAAGCRCRMFQESFEVKQTA